MSQEESTGACEEGSGPVQSGQVQEAPASCPVRKVPEAVLGLLLDEVRDLRGHVGTLASADALDGLSCQVREFVGESRVREGAAFGAAVGALVDLHNFTLKLREGLTESDGAACLDGLLLRIEDHLALFHVRPAGVRAGDAFDPGLMRIVRTEPAGEAARFSVLHVQRDGWLHQSATGARVVQPAHVTIAK